MQPTVCLCCAFPAQRPPVPSTDRQEPVWSRFTGPTFCQALRYSTPLTNLLPPFISPPSSPGSLALGPWLFYGPALALLLLLPPVCSFLNCRFAVYLTSNRSLFLLLVRTSPSSFFSPLLSSSLRISFSLLFALAASFSRLVLFCSRPPVFSSCVSVLHPTTLSLSALRIPAHTTCSNAKPRFETPPLFCLSLIFSASKVRQDSLRTSLLLFLFFFCASLRAFYITFRLTTQPSSHKGLYYCYARRIPQLRPPTITTSRRTSSILCLAACLSRPPPCIVSCISCHSLSLSRSSPTCLETAGLVLAAPVSAGARTGSPARTTTRLHQHRHFCRPAPHDYLLELYLQKGLAYPLAPAPLCQSLSKSRINRIFTKSQFASQSRYLSRRLFCRSSARILRRINRRICHADGHNCTNSGSSITITKDLAMPIFPVHDRQIHASTAPNLLLSPSCSPALLGSHSLPWSPDLWQYRYPSLKHPHFHASLPPSCESLKIISGALTTRSSTSRLTVICAASADAVAVF